MSAMFSKTSETTMFSYNTPVGYSGNKVSISHNSNRMRVSKGYMKDLDVRGNSDSNTFTFTKPVKTTITNRSEWVLELQQQKSVTKILGNDFVPLFYIDILPKSAIIFI